MELQRTHRARKEHPMLSKEKQMDVLEAYDLTKSLRAAAQLAGTDHHTVARYVAARAAGQAIEEMVQERPEAQRRLRGEDRRMGRPLERQGAR